VDLKRIIVRAFGLRAFQLAAPDWTMNQRFDIQAAVPAGAKKEQFEVMLQNLLIDRFHLAFHRELREMTRYELLVADGGPKLKEVQQPAPPANEPKPAPPTLADRKAMRSQPVDKDGYPIRTTPGFSNVNGKARFYQPQGPVDSMLLMLDMTLDEPVVNATGLTGTYEIELHWGQAPMYGQIGAAQARAAGGLSTAPPQTASDVAPAGPTIQQALRTQLGLKLQLKKGPMPMLVIDHVDRTPTEN